MRRSRRIFLTNEMKLRLHAFEPGSRANGPGLRAVVWFQGCTLGCPGCFNPTTHDPGGGYDTDTESVAQPIRAAGRIEGVSISGGDPISERSIPVTACSDRQTKAFTCSRYRLSDFAARPRGEAILHRDGTVTLSWIAPWDPSETMRPAFTESDAPRQIEMNSETDSPSKLAGFVPSP